MASMIPGKKFVFADNDESGVGEAAAKETGLPYCMSPTVGYDANDEHKKNGVFSVIKIVVDMKRSVLTPVE